MVTPMVPKNQGRTSFSSSESFFHGQIEQMVKSWAALLSKQDEGLLSSIEGSWAQQSSAQSSDYPKIQWFRNLVSPCFPLFPHQNDYLMFWMGLYPMFKHPQGSHSSVQGSDFGYLYPVQILPHMLQYSMVFHAKYHPSTSHPLKRW